MYLVECTTGRDGNVIVRLTVGVAIDKTLGVFRMLEDANTVLRKTGGKLELGKDKVSVTKCRNGLSYVWTIIEVEKIT